MILTILRKKEKFQIQNFLRHHHNQFFTHLRMQLYHLILNCAVKSEGESHYNLIKNNYNKRKQNLLYQLTQRSLKLYIGIGFKLTSLLHIILAITLLKQKTVHTMLRSQFPITFDSYKSSVFFLLQCVY